MECLVGHGAVSLGLGGVETRRGGSNPVATNKECLVAVGGGRRINQNCGAGVSSVSRHNLLSLHFVAFSNRPTCLCALERVQTIHIAYTIAGCNWAEKILKGLTPAAGTNSEAVLQSALWLWSLQYYPLFFISILLLSKLPHDVLGRRKCKHIFLSSISGGFLCAFFLSVVGSIPATGLRTYAWQQWAHCLKSSNRRV